MSHNEPVKPPDDLRSSSIDSAAAADAHRAWGTLSSPGHYGRLEDIGCWMAAVQGRCPARRLQRPVALIIAADHGIATTAMTSASPTDSTADTMRDMARGESVAHDTALTVDVSIRLIDAGVDADPGYLDDLDPRIAEHRIRRGSGSIDVEDALSLEESSRAVDLGRAIVDDEVDSGTDLIIAAHVGVGATTPASAIIGLLTAGDPVTVTGRGSGIDDAAWMRKVAAVRDAMYRSKDAKADIVALLSRTGGADIAVLTGILLQAAVRKTPVILDDVVVASAALLAHRLDFRSRQWWIAGTASTEPAQARAFERLDYQPVLDLQVDQGQGVGAMMCLPIVRSAIAIGARATVTP